MEKAPEMNENILSGWNPPQGYVARSKLEIIKQENRSAHELLSDIVELYELANFTDVNNWVNFYEIHVLCIQQSYEQLENKNPTICT